MRRIKKVAVLGSGLMGSAIACHLANAGLQVLMLDLATDTAAKGGAKSRNSIAETALANALKSKFAPLFDKQFADRISTGNFEDDFFRIQDCDWVIEAVTERLDIKHQILEKADLYRKPGSLISSNTSGIPIHLMLASHLQPSL